MFIERLVFRKNGCPAGGFRNILEFNKRSVFIAVDFVKKMLAGAIVNFRGLRNGTA